MQKNARISPSALEAVFRLLPLPCLVTDAASLAILDWNTAAEQQIPGLEYFVAGSLLTGVLPADTCLCGPEYDTSLEAYLKANSGQTSPLSFSCRILSSQKNYTVSLTPLQNEAIPCLLFVFKETAEEKNATELASFHKRLDTVYELARMGYWSRLLTDEQAEWSDEMYDLFGRQKGVFIPYISDVTACFHPDDRHLMQTPLEKLFPATDYRDFEYRVIGADGQTRWLYERTILIRDEHGVPCQLQGIVRDNTELKEKAIALKKSNERYELVLRATHEAICDWSLEDGKATWDDSFKDLFGHDVRQYDNDVWHSNIHAEDKAWVMQSLQEILDNKDRDLFFAEYRFHRADRSVAIIQHTCVVHRDAAGNAIRAIGSLRDVTAYTESLFRIQQQNQKLKDISWIQSHVVRAPLARLMGLAELMKNHTFEDIPMDQVMDHMTVAAEELDRIIRDIIGKSELIEQE